MNLFDTRTQAVQEFRPRGGHASIYVCGITPYDTTHLGHAFTYTSADILIRYLEFLGYPVLYVQSVTDIDDDIPRTPASRERIGSTWGTAGRAISSRICRRSTSARQILPARRVERHPGDNRLGREPGQGRLRLRIQRKRVLSRISLAGIGNISHIPQEEMLAVANQHGDRPDDKDQKNALDFVLWQAQAPGEPTWPTHGDLGAPAGTSNARQFPANFWTGTSISTAAAET